MASLLFLMVVVAGIIFLTVRQSVKYRRYNFIEQILYGPVYALARILWRVEIHWDPRWDSAGPAGYDGHHGDSDYKSASGSQTGAPDGTPRMLRDRMKTGAVLIANHRTSVDPFFIQLAAGGRVHWMVASEYFKIPIMGDMLRAYQAIPTSRGGADNAATKHAIQRAKSGRFVGMFPEGRINKSDAPILPVRPGAALVASKSGTPLVPIWIDGAPTGPAVYSPFFKSAHVRVYVGYPVPMPEAVPALEDQSANGQVSERVGRSTHVEWTNRAMTESLRLGNQTQSTVQMAGKSWLP